MDRATVLRARQRRKRENRKHFKHNHARTPIDSRMHLLAAWCCWALVAFGPTKTRAHHSSSLIERNVAECLAFIGQFAIPFDWLLLVLIAGNSNKCSFVVDIIRMVVASSMFWHSTMDCDWPFSVSGTFTAVAVGTFFLLSTTIHTSARTIQSNRTQFPINVNEMAFYTFTRRPSQTKLNFSLAKCIESEPNFPFTFRLNGSDAVCLWDSRLPLNSPSHRATKQNANQTNQFHSTHSTKRKWTDSRVETFILGCRSELCTNSKQLMW